MKRREFIAKTVPISFLPLMMGGFTIKAFGRSPFIESLMGAATETDKVLVLIQLIGGNDGLNTVIPLNRYKFLDSSRANILIPESRVLKLDDKTGFHPSMAGMYDLYQQGKMSVIQGVGYPNPDFSHFRSTDIWLTASDSNQYLNTGWLGRYLQEEYDDFPYGYPTPNMPDPLAIQIGSSVSPVLQGGNISMGMAVSDPTRFYQIISGNVDPAPNTPAGHELTYIRQVAQQSNAYSVSIKEAAAKANNLSSLYPSAPENSLGDQLKIIARLIAGGLKTRVYVATLGGFDTHSNQIVNGSPLLGTHATLLSILSKALFAFQDDLKLLNIEDRVVGMTFSEFGRRIKSNSSIGTDHGAGAPLFVFGKNVQPGILGTNPIIPQMATVQDNIAMQYDFRSVYASVLNQLFGVKSSELETILLKNYQILPILASTTGRVADQSAQPESFRLHNNYPNPFNPTTRIKVSTPEGYIQLRIFDSIGRVVRVLHDGHISSGSHEFTFHANGMPSGTYYCRLANRTETRIIQMALVK